MSENWWDVGKELWTYVPAPLPPKVLVAACPCCGAPLRSTMTLGPQGGVKYVRAGEIPHFEWSFTIKHGQPLCFEWDTERIEAEEILEALDEGDWEDES